MHITLQLQQELKECMHVALASSPFSNYLRLTVHTTPTGTYHGHTTIISSGCGMYSDM